MANKPWKHLQEQMDVSKRHFPLITECCMRTIEMAAATLKQGYRNQQYASEWSPLKSEILAQRSHQYLSEMYWAASEEMTSIITLSFERSNRLHRHKPKLKHYSNASRRYLADVAALYKKTPKGGKGWKRWF